MARSYALANVGEEILHQPGLARITGGTGGFELARTTSPPFAFLARSVSRAGAI